MTDNIFNLMMSLMNTVDRSCDNEAYKEYEQVRIAVKSLDDKDKKIIEEYFLRYTGDITYSFEEIKQHHLNKVLDTNYGY